MTFIELIDMGLFEAFWNFSNPIFNALAYLFLIIGIIIQAICNNKAKKRKGKYGFLIICIVICLIFECIAPSFTWMDLFAIQIFYCFAVYLLIGAIIALVVSFIKSRIGSKKVYG